MPLLDSSQHIVPSSNGTSPAPEQPVDPVAVRWTALVQVWHPAWPAREGCCPEAWSMHATMPAHAGPPLVAALELTRQMGLPCCLVSSCGAVRGVSARTGFVACSWCRLWRVSDCMHKFCCSGNARNGQGCRHGACCRRSQRQLDLPCCNQHAQQDAGHGTEEVMRAVSLLAA